MTPSSPLNLNVSIARNRDIITPLNLGTITYTDPTVFLTNQITEILILDAAIPFQRFATTAPFNLSGDVSSYPKLSDVFPGSDFEDKHGSGGFNVVSYQGGNIAGNWLDSIPADFINPNTDVYFSRWKDLWDRRVSLKEASARAGVWLDSQKNKVTSNWAAQNSLAFSPQIDVFSRFNKWFTSVTWMVPYDYTGPDSFTWPVLFIYADRVNKILYNVPGSISSAESGSGGEESVTGAITLNGGKISYFPIITETGTETSGVNVELTGISTVMNTELNSTAWKFELLTGDMETVVSVVKQSTNVLPVRFSGMDISTYPQFADSANSVRVKVRATSLDPQSVIVESNAIYLATN